MIIWKGLGFLGALIPFLFILLSNFFLGEEGFGWAFLTSAVPVWLLGRNVYKHPVERRTDSKIQQDILVKPEHTLFWVELDYWAIMIAIFGIPFVLPDSLGEFPLKMAMVLIAFIFLGRLSYSLYHKYLAEDISAAGASKNHPMTLENSIEKNKGISEAELKRKAFYAQMRKDREAPKKFGTSTHSNYFPGSAKMPFIPSSAIMNKETATEEE